MMYQMDRTKIILGLIAAGCVAYFGLIYANSCDRAVGQKAEVSAAENKDRADSHIVQAAALDAKARTESIELVLQKAKVNRLRERVPAIRPLVIDDHPIIEAGQPGILSGVLVDADASTRKDQLIEAQQSYILGLETKLATVEASRDQWESAFHAERARATSLQIALDAQKNIAKSGRWFGRIEGFAIGVGVGLLGGKL